MGLRLRKQPIPRPSGSRRLVFAMGPESGRVMWFLVDQTNEILRMGYVRHE